MQRKARSPSPSRARSLKSDGGDKNRMSADAPAPPRQYARLLDSLTSGERKRYPMTRGLGDYFPDALAAVSNVSFEGNEKHNPGEELHWSRGKSMDHADCIARHLAQRGGFDGPIRHSAALAWRALALLQEELENELGFEIPRGATARC